MTARLAMVAVLFGFGRLATGQAEWIVEGDSAVVSRIDETARRLTASVGRWTVSLIRRNLDGTEASRGSEVRGALVDGSIRRVVVATWTDRGRVMTEYLFDKDVLILVTQAMEVFDEDRTGWPAGDGRRIVWEQRYYLADERVRCRKVRGNAPKAESATSLIMRARAGRDIVRRAAEQKGSVR